MRKKAAQQGRSEQRGESYSVPYVEPLSEARTPLADFFRILLALSAYSIPPSITLLFLYAGTTVPVYRREERVSTPAR
jgi:hypothetical protein